MATARQQGNGHRRWGRGFRALTLASVFTLPAAAQTPGPTPQGGTVTVGTAGISSQGSQTLINQTSDRALIDWRRFDIGKDASVAVTQPGAGSILVNRVTGSGAGTRIDGSLTANGQVVVIDKAGVVIGRGARVDAGAFLATTADIDNADFAAGRLTFGKAGQAGAAIINEGTIRVADGGYAVLAAPDVRNSGVVEARLGRVVLAGTERFTLDLAGDGLLRFELPADLAGRVVNEGSVTGAQVLMTARAARDGMAGVVNAGGLVEATTAQEVDGRIIIGGEGTETEVTGTLRAAGGAIDILGDRVALTGALVEASGAGDGGQVRIGGDFQGGGDLHRARTTRIDADSSIRADGAAGAGGRVIVWSDGRTDYAGAISARGASDGGFAEVSGKGSLRFAGKADLAGGAGGKAGQLLLDPTNITIGTVADVDGTGAQDDDIPANGTIGSGDYGSVTSLITASAIASLLNNGTSVTLTASNDINVNNSIAKTGGTGATLSLTAGRDLSFASGVGVTSSSGSLSMGFTAGRSVTATNGSFTSNGGSITVTATGTGAMTGINLSGVSIAAGWGGLSLTGTGSMAGVRLAGNTQLSTGTGNLSVTGNGVIGVDFAYATASSTGAGTIGITGTAQGGSTDAVGIRLDGGSGGGIGSNGGTVTLTGAGAGSSGSANHGVLLTGGFAVSAGSGNLSVTATGGSGSVGLAIDGSGTFGGGSQSGTVTLSSNAMSLSGGTVRSSGRVQVRTQSNGTNLIIGGTDDTQGLALSTTELGTINAGTLTLGHDQHTGSVSVTANPSTTGIGALELVSNSLSLGSAITGLLENFLNAGKNATVLTTGSMIIADSIAKSAGTDAILTLRAGGDLTFSSAIGVTSSSNKLSMDFTGGYGGTGSLSTTGTGSFTSNGGNIGFAGRTGLSLNSSAVSAGAGTITLAGGDIALSATSITSSDRVILRPYAADGQMSFGGSTSGVANVSQAELNQISAGVIRLGALDGGNLVISSALSHASDTVELASGGNVTQTADINVANLSLLGTGTHTLTRSGNSVTSLAANTGTIDFRSGSSFAVGTVAGTTGITFTGNASLYASAALVTLGQTATYAGAGTGTLTLSGDIDVTVSANAGVSNNGKLNIVLAADGNAAGSSGRVAISNASLSTNGGAITIGSGATPATRAAEGKADTGIGVNILSSTLNSGTGGTILINGDGAPSGTNSATGIGINISASSLIAAGSGTITLNGKGGAGNSLTAGIAIGNGSTIRTASGALALNGEQASSGSNRYAILLRDDPTTRSAIYSTNSGGVELKATGTDGRISANGGTGDSSRAYIGWDGTNAYAGTVTLTADNMVLTSATGTAAISIGGSGTLILKPVSTGASIGVGDGAIGGNDLELGQAELDTLRAGFGSIVVGQSTGTGTVTVSGASFKDNTTIQGGTGAVTIAGALSTGTGGDAGTLSLETKGLLTISAAITTQNQNITLTADRLALTGSVNAGTATATLTVATASRAIDLGSTTNAAGALEISAAELNLVTAGVIRVGAANAGAINVSQNIAPTGSSTLHLRSGGGISQSGSITVSNLAVTAGGTVALASVNNDVTSLAVSASNQTMAWRDDSGFVIATVDGVAGASLGTGTLSLTSTGAVTQTAAIGAAGLALTGVGGAYTLAHASNAVSTIAADTGSVDVGVSGAASIGTAGSVTGITTTGTVKLSSGGNLTLAAGAAVSATGTGDALVLAANGTFTNNGGATSLSVSGGGRFLVFSASPLTSSTGGVDALPYYNRAFTFTDRTYTALTNTGNRFVYAYAPTLTVTPDAVNQTYSGATFTGSAYTITGLVTGDTLSNAVSGTASISGSGRNAGTYTLTAGVGTLVSDLGYGFSYGTGTLSVARKDLTYAVANGSSTYGTLATNGAVTLTGVVDGDRVAGTVTTWRGPNAETLAIRTDVGSLTQKVTDLTGTDAGNYQIAASGNSDGTLTIGQKALTYVIDAANSIYGTLATLGGATLTGVVEGDEVSTSVGLSGVTHEARLAAGSYDQTVTLGGTDSGNYSLAATGNSIGQLTVARKTLTYAITDVDSIYGTLATLSTPSLTGVLMGDTVAVAAQLQSGTLSARLAAGDYTLVAGDLTGVSAANYVLAGSGHTTGTLRVARKSLTATIAAVTSTYGTAASTGAVTFTGVLEGDTVGASVVVSGTGGTVTLIPTLDAGAYTQTVMGLTGSSATNYELTGGPVTAGLTVNRKDLTYRVANGTVTYGTLAGNGAVTFTGVVDGDTVAGTVTTYRGATEETLAVRTPVGTLTQKVTALTGADAGNYQIAASGHTDGVLTITQKALTYVVTAANSVYGTLATLGTGTLTGVVEGDSVTGIVSLSNAAHEAKLAAGTYDQMLTLTGSDSANYSLSTTGNSLGQLTVARKALTYSIADVAGTYGTQATLSTPDLSGVVEGDVITAPALLQGGTLSDRLAAGSYTLVLGDLTGAAAGNYIVLGEGNRDGTLVVSPKRLIASIESVTGTYGQAIETGTVTLDGLLTGDDVRTGLVVEGGGGTVTVGPTLGAGTYTQRITGIMGGDVANYVLADGPALTASLIVTPALLTVKADDLTRIYGAADPALTYTATGLVNGDGLTGSLTRDAGKNVGTYAIGQGSLTAGANYTISFQAGTLTIDPAPLSIIAASAVKTYGQADPSLSYSVTGLVDGDGLTGNLVRAAGRDAGTYAIEQGSLSAGANYTINFQAGTLTIDPAPLSIIAASAVKTYGQADPSFTYSVTGLVDGDSLTGNLVRDAGKDAGTYAIGQGSLSAGANYTVSFQAGTLTINPAALTIIAGSAAKTYGDADPTLSYAASGLVQGDGLTGALSRAGGENVGTYAIGQGSLSAGANYVVTFQGGELTVTPAALSVTANAVTRAYLDADPDLTYGVSGLKRGDAAAAVLSGTLSRAAGEDVGTYAITQGSLTANANYTLSFTGADLRITPASLILSVVAANASKIYGDDDPVFGYTASGLKGNDTLAGLLSGTLSRVAGEDVGTYAITQGSLALTNPNYVLSFTPGTLTISPASLSVAALMVTRTYGDADPSLTYSVSGLKRGDSAGSVLTGSLTRAGGEDVGIYAIGQGSLAAATGNYTLSFTGADLTINPALLSVTANAARRLYGAADPVLTYDVSGLKRGDAAGAVLSGGLTRAAGGTVGRYAIGQGSLGANANYRISFQGADLTIDPAPLSVLVDNATRQAGAANPVFTARFQGLVNGDTGNSLTGLVFQTNADAASPAGTYAVSAGGITSINYQITYVDGVLTVTGGAVLPPALAEAVPITTVTQPVRAPSVPTVTVAAPAAPAAPVAPPPAPASTAPAPAGDGGGAALAAVNQNVQSASGSAADDDSAAEEMIPGLLSQQRRLPGETPEGTPGLEQQFPNLGRVW
ncbi:MBG domain-containing protein [Niveispirillum sp.]|uniref:MBG domain-containing protein n=1 Tax=Niveispirillum sp. TaxID=1917217 RepID=UPI001B7BCB4C|nr:MBG domain-containing protein [Niveispirillum sp.]MBP7334483.1 filamentous hemagglutinin N-terminal domain-containing protein [Niveispirillum sp.]